MNADQISQISTTIRAGREAEEILWDFLNTNKKKIFVEGLGYNSANWTCIKEINFDDKGEPTSFGWEYDNDCDRDIIPFPTSAYLDLDSWVAAQKAKREIKKKQEQEGREAHERAELKRLQEKFK